MWLNTNISPLEPANFDGLMSKTSKDSQWKVINLGIIIKLKIMGLNSSPYTNKRLWFFFHFPMTYSRNHNHLKSMSLNSQREVNRNPQWRESHHVQTLRASHSWVTMFWRTYPGMTERLLHRWQRGSVNTSAASPELADDLVVTSLKGLQLCRAGGRIVKLTKVHGSSDGHVQAAGVCVNEQICIWLSLWLWIQGQWYSQELPYSG